MKLYSSTWTQNSYVETKKLLWQLTERRPFSVCTLLDNSRFRRRVNLTGKAAEAEKKANNETISESYQNEI